MFLLLFIIIKYNNKYNNKYLKYLIFLNFNFSYNNY